MENYNTEKLEISYKPINISFEEIMLLSKNEYLENKELISPSKSKWWLCSQGFLDHTVAVVNGWSGNVDTINYTMRYSLSVRPVLKIRSHHNLIPGDKIKISEYTFTVLHRDLALCDTCIGKSIFDNNYNDFKTSYIRKYLYNWAEENEIVFEDEKMQNYNAEEDKAPYWRYLPMTDKQRNFIEEMNYTPYNPPDKFDLKRENITRGEAYDFISKHIDEWRENRDRNSFRPHYSIDEDEWRETRKNYRTPYSMNETVVEEWGICESEYLGYIPGDQ